METWKNRCDIKNKEKCNVFIYIISIFRKENQIVWPNRRDSNQCNIGIRRDENIKS